MTRVVAVILAGGGGTRLWPVSRRGRPKQVLRLVEDRSLFAAAIERLRPWLEPDQILVAAPSELADLLAEEVDGLQRSQFLIEPEPRGTAPVLGLAAAHLHRRDPASVMAVLTSDHAIGRADRLQALLQAGAELAAAGHIVTLGIPPESPDTGYGYIRRGESLGEVAGEQAYVVREFKEKPDAAIAQGYLESGEYYWNSGMFLWRPARLLAEIERSMPELHRLLQGAVLEPGAEAPASFRRDWSALSPQTIDYGVMEHAERVAVLDAAGLGWSDIGNWDRVFQLLEKDPAGNASLGATTRAVEASGNLLVAEGAEKLIVVHGIHDLVVIDTGDVVLICRREQAGQVRSIVEDLERDGLERYLA